MGPVQHDEGGGDSESAVSRPAASRVDELASVLPDTRSPGIGRHDNPEPPAVEYVDVRDRCGATASLSVSSLTQSDVLITEPAASALLSRTVRGSSLVATAGRTSEADAIPQAADYLRNLEGITTVLVLGLVDGIVRLSARSMDSRVDIADTLTVAFEDVGQVGGHGDAAGVPLPLGLFADHDDDGHDRLSFAARRVRHRLFDAMHLETDDG